MWKCISTEAMDRTKIKVVYPDGKISMENVVADTYREAIRYLGVENIRRFDIRRNSINIVSYAPEIMNSKGKRESINEKNRDKGSNLYICTQFSTRSKYLILVDLNNKLQANLKIALVTPVKI